jgi:superfamily II DNA helicase RecQ
MKIHPTLIQKKHFTLLTAPVAKGKTKTIIDFYNENFIKLVFISPLRALAAEVSLKFENQKNVFWLGSDTSKNLSREDMCINFLSKKKAILITTVELLEDEFLELMSLELEPILFVFDEFHLFYTWGESFRPILFDKFLGVLNSDHPVIALSATINAKMLELINVDLAYHHDFWINLDYGNQELFRAPAKINFFGSHDKKTLERAFVRELKIKESCEIFLMFCSYRNEVFEKLDWAKRHGYRAIGCVGGEVDLFQNQLKENIDNIDCIFSTIALSHGVNLPEIKKVFINYKVSDYDFWLQMVGRGGRNGTAYEVYSFDTFHLTKKDQIIKYFSTEISDWMGIEI